MRFHPFIWTFIFLLLIPQSHTHYREYHKDRSPISKTSHLKIQFAEPKNARKETATIDTHQLKQSGWYNNALQSIAAEEYHIHAAAEKGQFTAPNREQNLRSFYTTNVFHLQPRKDSNEQWNLQLTTSGVYSGDKLVFSPSSTTETTLSGDTIRFHHQENFITEYINNEKGIRQNFIITKQPAINSSSISVHLQVNDGWLVNKTSPSEIQFAKSQGGVYKGKLTYNQLMVWDARHKELDASFQVTGNEIHIDVNTEGAVFPVMIDPISTTPNTIFYSQQAGASLGCSVASAGDVNGDGYSDVILGARNYDNGLDNQGMAMVFHGSASGIVSGPAIQLQYDQAGVAFGYSVSSAGDLNGDGYSDIVVGAPFYSNGESTEGAAFVYKGSAAGIVALPMAIVESNQDNAQMGTSVALAGDVNRDSYSDLIIGVRFYDHGEADEGSAFIYHGSATGLNTVPATIVESNQTGADMGASVASAGDVNGDGFSDVVVGANTYDGGAINEGAAFVFQGSSAGINPVVSIKLTSNQGFSLFGSAVSSAGDVNGDGYSDIMVGGYLYDSGPTDDGLVLLYQGSASGISSTPAATFYGNQTGGQLGTSLASAGDINADGYSDILIGAQSFDNGQQDEGVTFLYLGGGTGISTTPAATFEMNQAFASFGSSVASAGDVNGDGFSDILIGASNYDFTQTDEGSAYLYFGSADGPSQKPQFLNYVTQGGARFGSDANGAGDLNGDGFSDVIIGASLYDDNGVDEGRCFLFYGTATGIAATPNLILDEANQGTSYFGYSAGSAGDINGDGYGDLLIGAFGYNGKGRVYIYWGSATGISPLSNQVLDGIQNGEGFGVSVATAGDVNRDGYSDIVIGAYSFDDGANTDEGRAFIYHGSALGVNPVPAIILSDANKANSLFGYSAASAGDVNGDGFSDVIVGAYTYNGTATAQGVAFVYYGGCTGITSPANLILTGSGQSNAMFGVSVATAGDVNGDGFGDVIAGEWGYNGMGGRAYIFYGSAAGLSPTGFALDNNAPGSSTNDNMGFSVNSAGDINGDGYSDVIVGIGQFNNLSFGPPQGRAYIYLGKPAGLSNAPDFTITDNTVKTFFGSSVAGAGDINGDGYSDLVVGGNGGSWGVTGNAWVFYGNNKGGLRSNHRLYNTNLATLMTQSNIDDANQFGAGLFAKSFLGRQNGKLVWQSIRNGLAFSGTPISNSTQFTSQQVSNTDLGLNGVELKAVINKSSLPSNTYTRVRLKYDLTTAITGQVYGPWRYTEAYQRGNRAIPNAGMNRATFKLGNDTTVCFNNPFLINATTIGAIGYSWQDGSTSPIFAATGPGIYWVDVSVGGCVLRDSIVLGGTALKNDTLNPKICAGQTYTTPKGQILSTTGVYRDTLRSVLGCDSVRYTINLTVQTSTTKNSTAYVCAGQPYTLPWGTVVTTAGIYRDTLHYATTNCDSLIQIVDVIIQAATTETTNASICSGQNYTLPWGTVVNSAGIYRDTIRYVAGNCDSLIRIVTVNMYTTATQSNTVKLCQGQTYTLPWGSIVSASGIYRDTLRYTAGCDSVYRIVDLTIQSVTTQNIIAGICSGQTYTLPWGQVVTTPGIYKDTLRYPVTNCDSVYRIVNLSVAVPQTQTLSPTICAGQSYILPWGQIATAAGIYRDTLKFGGGCDSIYRIVTLTVQSASTASISPKICAGQSYTLPWGTIVNTSGTYRDTLHYATGCDSVYRIVTLTVQSPSTQTFSQKICSGQSYTLPWGTTVNVSGIYRDTLRYASGCDSVFRTVTLTVQTAQVAPAINAVTCLGQPYTLPWGTVVNNAGTYRDTLRYSGTGCDSVRRSVILTIQSPTTANSSVSICQGSSYTLPWGAIATSTGIYKDTLHFSNTGCDSLYRIVQVNVTAAAVSSANASICVGETYTLPWGRVVTAAGIYRDTVRTASGCDSLVRAITLRVNQQPNVTISKSNDIDCIVGIAKLQASGGVNYAWSPATGLSNTAISNPTASPATTTTYKVTVSNTSGCTVEDTVTVYVNKTGLANGYQLPNAFTPNNDGKNDCFGVRTWGAISNLKFQIFNRWGQLVFSTTDPSQCWDGRFKGELQPSSGFIYIISAETLCGPVKRTGTVLLIR